MPAFFSVDLHILHLLTALRVFRILLNAVIKSNYAPDDKTKNIGVVDLQNHQLGKTHLRVSLRFQILKEILIIGTAELLAQSDQPYKDHRKDHHQLRCFFTVILAIELILLFSDGVEIDRGVEGHDRRIAVGP